MEKKIMEKYTYGTKAAGKEGKHYFNYIYFILHNLPQVFKLLP